MRITNAIYRLRWLFVFLVLSPAPAFGTIEGIFRGRVTVPDARAARPASTVCDVGVLPCTVSVRRAIVSATVIPADTNPDSSSDCCTAAAQTFWTQTSDNGNFNINWRDLSRDQFPTRLRFTVIWMSTRGEIITETRDTLPNNVAFEIQGPLGEGLSEDLGEVGGVTAETPQRIQLGAQVSDESQTYLTALEVFRRIVRWSDTLNTRMRDVAIRTRVPGFGMSFGVAPFHDLAFISEVTPITSPRTVAHELGHVITWNAMNVNEARVGPLDYTGGTWASNTRETERAAFFEGLADFWWLAWQFDMEDGSTTVIRTTTTRTFNYELGRVTRNSDGDVRINCRSSNTSRRFEFPFCHTVTFWDLFDDNGPDGVRMSVANFVNTLNRYPNGCILNGCTEEPSSIFGTLNHHDFRRQIRPQSVRTAATDVFSSNGLGGGFP